MTAVGLLVAGLGVILLWDAVTNRNPIDEILAVFGDREVRPIDPD